MQSTSRTPACAVSMVCTRVTAKRSSARAGSFFFLLSFFEGHNHGTMLPLSLAPASLSLSLSLWFLSVRQCDHPDRSLKSTCVTSYLHVKRRFRGEPRAKHAILWPSSRKKPFSDVSSSLNFQVIPFSSGLSVASLDVRARVSKDHYPCCE